MQKCTRMCGDTPLKWLVKGTMGCAYLSYVVLLCVLPDGNWLDIEDYFAPEKLIVRTKDFTKRILRVAQQLTEFVVPPDMANPLLVKYLPERILKIPHDNLSGYVETKQLDFTLAQTPNPHTVAPGAISVTSFFCGRGVLDSWFRGDFTYKGYLYPRTSFDLLHAYDNNPKHIQPYQNNVGPDAFVFDLSNFDVETVPQARVLIGGFPYQDFATCGSRRGLKSTRGRLYQTMIQYANAHNPEITVGKTSPDLRTLRTVISWRRIRRKYGTPAAKDIICRCGRCAHKTIDFVQRRQVDE